MKNSRIAILLPSEAVPKSTNQDIHNPGADLSRIPKTHEGLIGGHCKGNDGDRRVGRFRTADRNLCGVAGLMLIALLLFIGSQFHLWAVRLCDPMFDHWVWHQPTEDWNL